MEKSKEGMIVAHRPGEEPVGWCWVSINQNAMTGDRYANFRSLAVSPLDNRGDVAELLLTAGLEFCAANGITEVVGRVHVGNVPMRTVYRKFGFDPTSLSMKLFLPPKGEQEKEKEKERQKRQGGEAARGTNAEGGAR